jgi:hypothetical protein
MEAPELWVANNDGTEIVRVRDIAAVVLDYDGNVAVRLVGHEGPLITLVAHRTHHDEHRPRDLHRQLLRVAAELADSSGAHILRPVHDERHGWQWVSEPL